jgi:peptidoglycan/LPS O-acetylase OafA/YrhL
MGIWSSVLVSLLLLLFAAGLMAMHVQSWRRLRRREPDPHEFDYRRRQLRRRMQTSGLLGLLAVAIFVGQWVTEPNLLGFLFWGGVLLVLAWVALLAIVDMLATKHHFARLRQTYLVEEAKLQAELRRIRATAGNGKLRQRRPASKDRGPGKT